VKPISLKNKQHHDAEYLRINPKAKVPVLVVEGEPLTENVAILTWLAGAFPEKKLLPTGKNAIKALSLMAWCASGLHPPLTRIFDPARYCSVPGSEESIRKLALEEVIKNFGIVDGMLAEREWMFDHWTAVDAYLFWVWRRFGIFKIDIPSFPNYAGHGERMVKRDSVKRALAFEREVQARAAA